MKSADYSDGSLLDWGKILSAAGVSALLALVVFLLLSRPWRSPDPTRLALGWTLGVGLALIAGVYFLDVEVAWPPRVDQQRFLMIVLPAVVLIETAGCFKQVPRGVVWSLRLLLACCLPMILLYGTTYLEDFGLGLGRWTATERSGWLTALVIGLLAEWVALLRRTPHTRSGRLPALLMLTCVVAAGTVMLSGYASAGLLLVPLVVAVLAVSLASWFMPGPHDTTGAVSILVVGLYSLLVLGLFMGTLSLMHAILLWLAPLACWLEDVPSLRNSKPALRLALPGSLMAIILAVVVIQAGHQFMVDSNRPATPPARSGPPSYLDTLSQEQIVDEYQDFMKRSNPPEPKKKELSTSDPFGDSP